MQISEEILVSYGFVPWQKDELEGWYRQVTFVKDSALGEVAKYYADDYIIIKHQGKLSVEKLMKTWQSKEDVIKHRFLLLNSSKTILSKKAYRLGFRGWLEVLEYKGGDKEKRFEDLIFLVNV